MALGRQGHGDKCARRSQVDKRGSLRRARVPRRGGGGALQLGARAGAGPVLITVRSHCKESQPGSGAAAPARPPRTKASYILNEGESQPRPLEKSREGDLILSLSAVLRL